MVYYPKLAMRQPRSQDVPSSLHPGNEVVSGIPLNQTALRPFLLSGKLALVFLYLTIYVDTSIIYRVVNLAINFMILCVKCTVIFKTLVISKFKVGISISESVASFAL